MRQSQQKQILHALVRDGHQDIDRLIDEGSEYVIQYLAHSRDFGDRMDFQDFCAWCKYVKRYVYVKAYLACGGACEAAAALCVPEDEVRAVLRWCVRNFPW